MQTDLSIVVPVFNEAANVGPLCQRLRAVVDSLGLSCEVIFVSDGSVDDTVARLHTLCGEWPAVRAVELSRRFGKEAALTCGLAEASGRAVVTMDGDLQHPPEVISEFVARWRQGYEMVFGVRDDRADHDLISRIFVRTFYWLFDRMTHVQLPRDAGDFRLFDRKVVDALNILPERNRFMKGLYAWLGFRNIGVRYECAARASGRSKWTRIHQLRYAFDAITAFSNLPLRVLALIGGAVSILAFFYIVVRLLRTVFFGIDVPGYESTLAAVLFLGGVQLVSLGIIGDYLGRVFEETKGRPLYIIKNKFGGGKSLAGTAANEEPACLEKA